MPQVLLCGYCRIRPAVDEGPCEVCFDHRSPLWRDYHYNNGPLPEIIPPFMGCPPTSKEP